MPLKEQRHKKAASAAGSFTRLWVFTQAFQALETHGNKSETSAPES
jgi:hypothetical protein